METKAVKFLAVYAFLFLLGACARRPPLSPMSASALAAEIANDSCYARFGKRPFTPEDYEAIAEGNRWYWGSREGQPVDGYNVNISFNRDGSDRLIQVRFGSAAEDSVSAGFPAERN